MRGTLSATSGLFDPGARRTAPVCTRETAADELVNMLACRDMGDGRNQQRRRAPRRIETWTATKGRMAYSYTIERRPRLVRLSRVGEADVADWRETMLRLINDPAFVEGTPILFDLRQSDSNPPPGHGSLLAAMWQDFVGSSRVAMVASKPETLAITKNLELLSKGHVRTFDNAEEARAWLAAAPRRRGPK